MTTDELNTQQDQELRQVEEKGAEKEPSAEQLASEFHLDSHIPDAANESATGESEKSNNPVDVNRAVKDVLGVIPFGLDLAGLQNASAVWSDDVRGHISVKLIPVMQKYAFGQKILAYIGDGGGVAEGALLMALYPVAIETYYAAQYDISLRNQKRPEKVPDGDGSVTGVHSADSPLGSTFKFVSEG